jgi:hypothetical protein
MSVDGKERGDSRAAKAYLEYLPRQLGNLEQEIAYHILNGMLYEVYFDRSDRFREDKKVDRISDLLLLEDEDRFQASFHFDLLVAD